MFKVTTDKPDGVLNTVQDLVNNFQVKSALRDSEDRLTTTRIPTESNQVQKTNVEKEEKSALKVIQKEESFPNRKPILTVGLNNLIKNSAEFQSPNHDFTSW